MCAVETLDFLLGRWSVVRTVTDYRADVEGRFEGWADVRERTPQVPGRQGRGRQMGRSEADQARRATYEEVGRFHLARYEGAAQRHLCYRRRPDASLLVEFTDGRPFVVVDLRVGYWLARHDCGPDEYDITFLVRSSDAFEEHWRVHGPSKDYEARAAFVRDRQPSGASRRD